MAACRERPIEEALAATRAVASTVLSLARLRQDERHRMNITAERLRQVRASLPVMERVRSSAVRLNSPWMAM